MHRQTSYQCMGKMVSLLCRIVGSELLKEFADVFEPPGPLV